MDRVKTGATPTPGCLEHLGSVRVTGGQRGDGGTGREEKLFGTQKGRELGRDLTSTPQRRRRRHREGKFFPNDAPGAFVTMSKSSTV